MTSAGKSSGTSKTIFICFPPLREYMMTCAFGPAYRRQAGSVIILRSSGSDIWASLRTIRYARSPVFNGGSGRPRSDCRALECNPSAPTMRSASSFSPVCHSRKREFSRFPGYRMGKEGRSTSRVTTPFSQSTLSTIQPNRNLTPISFALANMASCISCFIRSYWSNQLTMNEHRTPRNILLYVNPRRQIQSSFPATLANPDLLLTPYHLSIDGW